MADEVPEDLEQVAGSLFDAEQRIEHAIRAYDDEIDGDNALLMGWVIVAEWIDANGDPNLTAFAREGMPYWRINALIDAAPAEILYDEEDFD